MQAFVNSLLTQNVCVCASFNLNMRTPSDCDHNKPTVHSALYRSTLLLPHFRFL